MPLWPTWRGSRTPGSRPITPRTRRLATIGDLAELSPRSPARNPDRVSTLPRVSCAFERPAASIWASAPDPPTGPAASEPRDRRSTRSSPVPTPTSGCGSCRPLGYDFAMRSAGGRNPIDAAGRAGRPHVRLRNPSGRIDRIRRCRLPRSQEPRHERRDLARECGRSLEPPSRDGTGAAFGLIPAWLPLSRLAARRWRGRSSLPDSPAGTAGSRCPSGRRSCSSRTTSSMSSAPRSRFRRRT